MQDPHRVREQLAMMHEEMRLMAQKLDFVVNTLTEEKGARHSLARRVLGLERFATATSVGAVVASFILSTKIKKILGLN